MDTITDCFNLSFSDYIVQFNATTTYLKNRWKGARVDYKLSYGLFDEDKMVGFIVNGVDYLNGILTAHNNGTGVIPSHRGNRFVDKIYEKGIPEMKEKGVQQCTLEVIKSNVKAIRVYERVGFKITRSLPCFSGQLKIKNPNCAGVEIVEVLRPNWTLYSSFWDVKPSWEHLPPAINATRRDYNILELVKQDNTIGYVIINPETSFIPQFGIHPGERGKGYGQHLFYHIAQQHPSIKINNVDDASQASIQFLKKIGLDNPISQFEMKMKL